MQDELNKLAAEKSTLEQERTAQVKKKDKLKSELTQLTSDTAAKEKEFY